MAIIDMLKWNAPDGLYAWKYPSEELATWTQLVVAESQEAVFVKDGRMLGPFKAGRHTLDTKNYPVLAKFFSLPFGGRSPFTAEVWFVNRAIPLDVKWGTSDPIQLQDPRYGVMLPVRAFGQFAVQVVHATKFLKKLVGTVPAFDRERLVGYFRGLILTRAKNAIGDAIVREGVSILDMSTRLSALSEALRTDMAPELELYGLELRQFFVHSINVPEDDPAVSQLKAALAKRAEMDILGYSYQQERTFDTLETAAGNTGGASVPMNAGMGLSMGVGVGQVLATALDAQVNAAAKTTAPPPEGKETPTTTKSAASSAPTPAPVQPVSAEAPLIVEAESPSEAAPGKTCPSCGASAMGKFCHACGKPMAPSCGSCGTALPAGAKFCPECGAPTSTTPKHEETPS